MNVITMGAHILDVLVRPVTDIPPGQETALVEQVRMTAAGTAAGTALTSAKLGAAVRSAGAIGTDPARPAAWERSTSSRRRWPTPTICSQRGTSPRLHRGRKHLAEGSRRLLDAGAGLLTITCGADGALIVSREGNQQVPAFAVDVADTTGCGAAISAGFVYATRIGRSGAVRAALLG
jgi:sugar/nucleoside kinase (ribokinase family)